MFGGTLPKWFEMLVENRDETCPSYKSSIRKYLNPNYDSLRVEIREEDPVVPERECDLQDQSECDLEDQRKGCVVVIIAVSLMGLGALAGAIASVQVTKALGV